MKASYSHIEITLPLNRSVVLTMDYLGRPAKFVEVRHFFVTTFLLENLKHT